MLRNAIKLFNDVFNLLKIRLFIYAKIEIN